MEVDAFWNVSSEDNLVGSFQKTATDISATLSTSSLVGSVQLSTILVEKEYDIYNGSYEVTPSSEEQVLNTAGCNLTNDITVFSIPYFETSNTSNGYTVYIG